MLLDGSITVGNKDYLLKYTINTLCEMNAKGIDIMKLQETMDFMTLRTLIFYGLKKFHASEIKTEEEAGDVMSAYVEQGGSFEELATVMSKALSNSLGIKEVVEGK